jgi:uncharacterized repeat protein (TIGR01451 family)
MKTHTTPQTPHVMNGQCRFSALLQLSAALILAAVAGPVHADPGTDVEVSDLALTMSLSASDAVAGDKVTFTLGVTNRGPQDAANVRVEDQLPSGYAYLNDNGSGAYDPATGIWTVGMLELQETVTLQIEAMVLTDGAHLNMASATSDSEDPVSENNHAMKGVGGLDGPTIGGPGEFIPRAPASEEIAAVNPAPVQTFFIPIPEAQLLQALKTIKPTRAVEEPENPVHTYVSVAVLQDNTIIYYDQMENGYDVDISAPSAAYHSVNNPSGTQVWGDGDATNGFAPGHADDVLRSGSVIVLNNPVNTTVSADPDAPRFNGGDKIAASKAISVTRAGWASGTATMLAGSIEVFDTYSWGTDYRVPVGENITNNTDHEMFEYTGAAIMAGEGGASVSIDADNDGVFESTVNLAQGKSHLVNGGLAVGARIESSAPVQVDLLTGDINEIFESRYYRLLPAKLWSDTYYSPVSTPSSAQGFDGTSTTVWLYNPNPSAITVTHSTRNGSSLTSNVSNKQTTHASVPLNGTTPGNVYGPIKELKSDGSLDGSAPSGAWIGIVNRSSGNSPSISSKVSKARSEGASAVIVVNNYGGNSFPSDSAGSAEIPVVGLTQNGGDALRAAGLGSGWVRVSGSQTSSTISVPAKGYAKKVLTDGYGAGFKSNGGENFYALTTTDSTTYDGSTSGSRTSSPVGNQNWDWGITLVPQSSLTQQALVGLGIGRDPTLSTKPDENGNPAWITTIGNGNADATVYVDFDADPATGPFVDPNGYKYDLRLSVREYENVKIYNPAGDQSGMLIYTLDAGVKLAAAWGQDVLISSRQEPGLDMGTGIPPLPKFVASKRSVLVSDNDSDGFISPGDGLRYEIEITNISRVPISDLRVEDVFPAAASYVTGSVSFTDHTGTVAIPDGASGTPFPLDAGGVVLPTSALPPFATWRVSYRADILPFASLPVGTEVVENQATISSALLALTEAVTVKDVKPLHARIGDFVWNDLNADGIQGPGETGLSGVTVTLFDGENNTIATTATDANGWYLFTGLSGGDYRVGVTLPAGFMSSPLDADGNGLAGAENSDIDPSTGKTSTISLMPGEPLQTVDAGLVPLGCITANVWADTTGDGNGDTPLTGVTVTLIDAHDNPVTAITGPGGGCSFENLVPGQYRVVETDPSGYVSVTVNELDATVLPGGTEHVDFTDTQPSSISGYVFFGEVPLAGVTLTLLDESGNPVDGDADTEGVQPVTTVTNGSGYYAFFGVAAGTWQIAQTQPYGYTSFGDADGGDPDIIGDVTPIVILPGDDSVDNNFIETLDTCPDDWDEWKFQHPGETADGNPDADKYDNFAEFAFAMPYDQGVGSPWLGHTAWVIQPSGIAPGTLEGVFVRPKGALSNVTYTLQYAPALGNPTTWQEIAITQDVVTVVDNGDCTETVTIHDLETLTGMTGGEGFVRIRADLDDDGGHNGDIDHTSFTEVEGWTATDLDTHCQTYNNPYLAESLFTGTISEVIGSDAVFGIGTGPVDLAELFDPAYSYFIEVESGDLEGHRFDIVAGSGNALTLADGSGTMRSLAVGGGLPAQLAGDRIAVHRHRTINDLFPPTGFGAAASRGSADKVQIFKDGSWSNYWLFDNDGSPIWLLAGSNDLVDRGVTVVPPGQGVFFDNHNDATAILAYGEVRMNRFVRPLDAGHSLVGGGYPIDQSANGAQGRDMNAANSFIPTNDFKTADSFFYWNGDFNPGAVGYTTYYLLNGSRSNPERRWVKVGDAMLNARDSETLLLGDRAVFIRSKDGLAFHTMPLPWSP